MLIVYVTVASAVVFVVAAIAKPHSWHEVPVPQWLILPFLAGFGAYFGVVVGPAGGVVSWLVGKVVGFTVGPRTARILCPFVSALTTVAAGTVAWMMSADTKTGDPVFGSYWLIANEQFSIANELFGIAIAVDGGTGDPFLGSYWLLAGLCGGGLGGLWAAVIQGVPRRSLLAALKRLLWVDW